MYSSKCTQWLCTTGVHPSASSCASPGSGQYAGGDGSEGGGGREAEEEDPGAGGDAEASGGGAAAGDQSPAGWGGLPLCSSRVGCYM